MATRAEEDIYREHVLEHYEAPYHRGACPGATHVHEDDNPLCGDTVHVEVRIEDGVIREAWFTGEGCCISQACASMLVERLEGMTIDDLKRFSARDMLALYGPPLTSNRQKCCLLPWRVAQSVVHAPVAAAGSGADRAVAAATDGDAPGRAGGHRG